MEIEILTSAYLLIAVVFSPANPPPARSIQSPSTQLRGFSHSATDYESHSSLQSLLRRIGGTGIVETSQIVVFRIGQTQPFDVDFGVVVSA